MENEKSNILQVIGSNIKRARLLRGLTQEALSEELNTSTNFISLVERGASGVSLTNLVDLCNILRDGSRSVRSWKYNAVSWENTA